MYMYVGIQYNNYMYMDHYNYTKQHVNPCKMETIYLGEDLFESVEEIRDQLPHEMPVYIQGRRQIELSRGYLSLDDVLQRTLPVTVCKQQRDKLTLRSNICYIYTSGTTGRHTSFIYLQHLLNTDSFNVFAF